MRKRVKRKSPFPRLILALLLTGVLFGAGFYAYYKRTAMPGATFGNYMSDTLERMKTWFTEHKQRLNEELTASKNLVPLDAPRQEEVKFEFYDSLADMKVNVDAQPSRTIVNHDDVEQEFKKQLKVTK